eukprot:2863613-Pleurochrysis_carterae.AAC.1
MHDPLQMCVVRTCASQVVAPRKALGALSSERLRVRQKDNFRLKYVPYLLTEFKRKLTHGHGGLVFLHSEAPLCVHASDAVIAWVPTDDGSLDHTGSVSEAELTAWAKEHFSK